MRQLIPISVVMPVYNGKTYLHRAILSVLNQSFSDFEFLIIDDGSTDGSSEILLEYQQKDRRIRVVARKHLGLIAALNEGCNLARGKYIARLDCDDIAKSWRLEQQINYLNTNRNIVLLGGSTECIDGDDNLLFTMHWPSQQQGLRDYMLLDCQIAHTTVMFTKEVFVAVGGYRPAYRHAEDYDLFLRIGDKHGFDNLDQILCQYRLHSQQISSQQADAQIISSIGARLATKMRRSGLIEPKWRSVVVAYEDLIANGISTKRIDALTSSRLAATYLQDGWRWHNSPFCERAQAETRPS